MAKAHEAEAFVERLTRRLNRMRDDTSAEGNVATKTRAPIIGSLSVGSCPTAAWRCDSPTRQRGASRA